MRGWKEDAKEKLERFRAIKGACSTRVGKLGLSPEEEEKAIQSCTNYFLDQLVTKRGYCKVGGVLYTSNERDRTDLTHACNDLSMSAIFRKIDEINEVQARELARRERELHDTTGNLASLSPLDPSWKEIAQIEAEISQLWEEIRKEARKAPDEATKKAWVIHWYEKYMIPLVEERNALKQRQKRRVERLKRVREFTASMWSPQEEEVIRDSEESAVQFIHSPPTQKVDQRITEVLGTIDRIKGNQSKNAFHTPTSGKSEDSAIIMKAKVQCRDCGWITEIKDLKTAKIFRRGEIICPDCNSIHFKIKNAFPYTIKRPYYLEEEEIRGEMINKIYDVMNWAEVFDCRPEQCPDPYTKEEIQFVPRTGDILLKIADNFHGIELKLVKMFAKPYDKGRNLYFIGLRQMKVSLLQLEYVKRGLMTLIIIGELIEDSEQYGIEKKLKTEEAIKRDICTLRKGYGSDRIPYAYLIIDTANWMWFQNYFQGLGVQETIRSGRVVDRCSGAYFSRIYALDMPKRRFKAVRSEITSEIVTRLARKNRFKQVSSKIESKIMPKLTKKKHFKERYVVEKPYYLHEEEIRNAVLDVIRKNLAGCVRTWDCRYEYCPEPFQAGGYEFVPRTGDILMKTFRGLHLIELKYAKMFADKNDKGKYFRTMRRVRITSLQLKYIEKGLMTLVCIGELIENPNRYGVKKGLKTKEAVERDILTLREAYGNDMIPYAYFIINHSNLEEYKRYFKKLTEFKQEDRGKIVARYKGMTFRKMYHYDFPMRRYRAFKSNLVEDIVAQLIKRKVFE